MDAGTAQRVRHPGTALARVVAVGSALAGAVLVSLAVLAMNRLHVELPAVEEGATASFRVPTPPPPRAPEQKKRQAPRKKASRAPPPAALLTAGLSGLDVGLPGFDASALDGSADELLGEDRDVVMTEDTVDQPPRPLRQVAPAYPAAARARNLEGSVTLALLVDEEGRVGDVQVLASEPPGVFDQAALAAVRTWTFEPALYQGEPVRLRLQLVMPFRLE